ncbi:MAG: hypothetical protein ACYCU7_16870 [Acidimicrobiales bacterium]
MKRWAPVGPDRRQARRRITVAADENQSSLVVVCEIASPGPAFRPG